MTPKQTVTRQYNWYIRMVKGACASLRRVLYQTDANSLVVTKVDKIEEAAIEALKLKRASIISSL